MADPIVHITNGVPDGGTGNITTLGAVVAALPVALGAGGGLKVDGSGTALPVSMASTTITGTVAVTESGTWTVQPGNTPNTAPWLTKIHDGTTAALVKAASSGGALATDPALVVTLRDVNANGQAVMASSAPVTIASNQSAVPVTLAGNSAVNIAQVNGTTVPVGSGVQATAPRYTLATDSPGIVTLGSAVKASSVPMVIASDQMGSNTFANSLPVTLGPALIGSFNMSSVSGTMAAGLAANAPIFAFRYGGAAIATIRKVVFSAGNTATAFAAGIVQFQLFAARSYSVNDTGGTASTLTTNNGKLRTSLASTAISDFRTSSTATLTAGTRTLDATPLGSYIGSVPAVAGSILVPVGTFLLRQEMGEEPLILANNEGFVIQATVPATGTWTFSVQVYWDEVAAF